MSRRETVDKRHGRLERRFFVSTGFLSGYWSKWPRVKQVFRLVRWRGDRQETAYGIASIGWSAESAGFLLPASRRHRGIGNSLHHVRDVTYDEDRCRTRSRNKGQLPASFRNLSIMRHRSNFSCVPEGIEYYAEHRDAAIAALFQRTE